MTNVCIGKLGTAVLTGLLQSTLEIAPIDAFTEAAYDARSQITSVIPDHFIACVRAAESREKLTSRLAEYKDRVSILVGDNLRGACEAGIIVLGCKPHHYREVLSEPGVQKALRGKILLSMLGGVTSRQLAKVLDPETGLENSDPSTATSIVRTLPNIAASMGKSMTLIEQPDNGSQHRAAAAAVMLFSRVGRVKLLAGEHLEVGTVITASSPAFFAVLASAITQNKALRGLGDEVPMELVAGSLWSTAHLLFAGSKPDDVQRQIATPGGSTDSGLQILTDSDAGTSLAQAIQKTFDTARGLESPGTLNPVTT